MVVTFFKYIFLHAQFLSVCFNWIEMKKWCMKFLWFISILAKALAPNEYNIPFRYLLITHWHWGFIIFLVRISSEIWPPISTTSVHYDVAFLALLVPDYHVGQVKEMSSVGFANISCWVDGVAKIYDITPYFSPLLTHLKLSLLVCNTFTKEAGEEVIESIM